MQKVKMNNNYITKRSGFGMLLLSVVVVVSTGHLHGEPQITQTTCEVCFHQNISRVKVPMSYTQFHPICLYIQKQ